MTEQKRPRTHPTAVSDLLADIFQNKPIGKRLKESRIWLVWDKAVGKQIATHARPAKFRDGVLTVAVASAPWMQQLTFLKDAILEKLNNALGEPLVSGIYLKAGRPEPTGARPEQKSKRPAKLSPAREEWIAGETASINDRELRNAMRALMRKALAGQD